MMAKPAWQNLAAFITKISYNTIAVHAKWHSNKDMFMCRSYKTSSTWIVPRALSNIRYFHHSPVITSGHSHWANIKVGKMANDHARSIKFSRLSNQIATALRTGPADPKVNTALARLIEEARTINVSKDTLQRMLSRKSSGENLTPTTIVVKGPGSTLVLVSMMSAHQRKSEVGLRTVLNKHGGQIVLQSAGVMTLFSHKGIIVATKTGVTEDKAIEDGITAGAEEVIPEETENGGVEFTFECPPLHVDGVQRKLEALGYEVSYSAAEYTPLHPMPISSADEAKLKNLLDKIQEIDEVTQVATNAATADSS